MKTKSPLQYEALEKFYEEEKYPTHQAMDELAAVLDLTYKQVRGWFVEKRRRDKNKNIPIIPPRVLNKIVKGKESSVLSKSKSSVTSSSMYRDEYIDVQTGNKRFILNHQLFTPTYILGKLFRKDGPPLGLDFDPLPARGFCFQKGSRASPPNKHSKVSDRDTLHSGDNGPPLLHQGMTVWRATNSDGEGYQGSPPSFRMNQQASKQTQVSQTKHGMGKGLITA